MSPPRRCGVRPTAREFLAEAERAAGRTITVLSGREEAAAAANGVAFSFYRPDGIVGDLGGGSVDLSRVTPDGPAEPAGSLPLGTLPVTAMLDADPVGAALRVDEELDRLPWLRQAARGRRFYVVGGGWRALARIRQALTDAPLKVVHDYSLPPEAAATLGRTIARLDDDELATVPGHARPAGEHRPGGRARLRARRPPPRARRGRLLSLRPARGPRLPAPRTRAPCTRTRCSRVPRDFGRSRARVPAIGAGMARWTAPLFKGETEDQRRIRLAACEVSDSAWREHPAFRAREAFYRLAQYPFIGLTHAERVFIAFAIFCRYEGSPEDGFIRPIDDAPARPGASSRPDPGCCPAARLPHLRGRARPARHQPSRDRGRKPRAAPARSRRRARPRYPAAAPARAWSGSRASRTSGSSPRAEAATRPAPPSAPARPTGASARRRAPSR